MTLNSSPANDAQWAREVDRRLKALESPRTILMGNWCVSVSPITGDLVADHIPTGRRTAIAEATARSDFEKEK